MHPSLEQVDHRPWPVPEGRWNLRQQWLDLLFAHWPIDATVLKPLVPEGVEIEEYGGTSWVGVVPFRMTGVMFRGLPDLPWLSAFPELNLRLYVRHGGRSGVWFLSLDAPNLVAVLAARFRYGLPYHWSKVEHRAHDGADADYPFTMTAECGRAQPPLRFRASYGPAGAVFRAKPGSLEHFLTERYCLFTRGRGGKILRVDVHHEPWPLQPGRAEVDAGDLLRPFGLGLPECAPHLLFSSGVRVVSWPACVVRHEMETVSTGSRLRPALGMNVSSAANLSLGKAQRPGRHAPA
jgi:uncharacterized protein YqjF (DUF2071 family)